MHQKWTKRTKLDKIDQIEKWTLFRIVTFKYDRNLSHSFKKAKDSQCWKITEKV